MDVSYLRNIKISNILDTDDDIKEDELKWVHITDGPIVEYGYLFSSEKRNYYWFGRMSEVRGVGPRITHPLWPDDNNDQLIKDNYWEYNHSHSHIYLNELLDIEWTSNDQDRMSIFINEDIPRMVAYCDERDLEYKHFRILISYDS